MLQEQLSQGQAFELRTLGNYTKLRDIPWMNQRDAIELAKRKQLPNWNPANPSTPFGRGFLRMLNQTLNRMQGASKSWKRFSVSLYVCVDTPLDQHWGVDAIVALRDFEFQHDFIVTLDLSLNQAKITGKADFIIGENDVAEIERGDYMQGRIEPNEVVVKIAEFLWMYWFNFNQLMK